MTAKTTRIFKEARSLLWPWCAVMIACALPRVIPPRSPLHLFFWELMLFANQFGILLLVTLPFGNEFQHRTLSLLLSQPIDRMEIWWEKFSVTLAVVLSVALVVYTRGATGPQVYVFVATWNIATIASATFWTLLARSTLGGMVLNIAADLFIGIAWSFVPWHTWLHGYTSYTSRMRLAMLADGIVRLCYAGVMLWLGRRALARFQVTGGMAGDDLLTAGPDVMPKAWAGWLRCRPTGLVRNLIRKELRLQRPVWLFSLLAAVCWACLTLFGLPHPQGFPRYFETAVASVGVFSTLIIAILAGSLSLGEEKTSGTYSWHMTLPVPVFLQWRIKLYAALFAGLVGAGLLPVLIAGRSLFGKPPILENMPLETVLVLGVLILTFTAFWCACAADGTVRAVLWVLPVLVVLGLAGDYGEQGGDKFMDLFVSRFDPFATFRFTNAVTSTFALKSFLRFENFFHSFRWSSDTQAPLMPILAFLLVPILPMAAIQSYRLFRKQPQASAFSTVRSLLPLALMAFLCSFSLTAFGTFVRRAWLQDRRVTYEILQAVDKLVPGATQPGATLPLQLRADDLAKASPLSEDTRRWMGTSRVTLAPLKSIPHHRDCCAGNLPHLPNPIDDTHSWYLPTLRFAGGSDCTESFVAFPSL